MHDPNPTGSLSGFFELEALDVGNLGREEERTGERFSFAPLFSASRLLMRRAWRPIPTERPTKVAAVDSTPSFPI